VTCSQLEVPVGFNSSRRRFLCALGAAAPALALPGLAWATAPAHRELAFSHTHTGEKLKVLYFDAGQYVPDALAAVNRLLRDFRTGDVHPIDQGLLDLLHDLRSATGSRQSYQIVSAYRSPLTNLRLQQAGRGVATRSLHMDGKAIDVRLADVPLPRLRRAAQAQARGGVGYYPASDFIHVDTGRVRYW
jgi:uncharacterized protein YcbK (DUF882 family)